MIAFAEFLIGLGVFYLIVRVVLDALIPPTTDQPAVVVARKTFREIGVGFD